MSLVLLWYQSQTTVSQENCRPIYYEYEHKNTQQNASKSNPITYKKGYIPQAGGVYPRNAKLVQNANIVLLWWHSG